MQDIALDNSTAVFLAKLGLFNNLDELSFITTKEIEKEILDGVERGYRDAIVRKDWIEKKKIKIRQQKHTEDIVKMYHLTYADASIIALAKEEKAIIATEDDQLRKIAEIEGIPVTNVSLLIYHLFKKKSVETKKILHLLDMLERFGYRKEAILKIKEKILVEVK